MIKNPPTLSSDESDGDVGIISVVPGSKRQLGQWRELVAVFSFLCTRRLIREWGPRFHHVFTGFSVCILGIAFGALFGNVRFICCAHFAAVSGASLLAFLSYGLFPVPGVI